MDTVELGKLLARLLEARERLDLCEYAAVALLLGKAIDQIKEKL